MFDPSLAQSIFSAWDDFLMSYPPDNLILDASVTFDWLNLERNCWKRQLCCHLWYLSPVASSLL